MSQDGTNSAPVVAQILQKNAQTEPTPAESANNVPSSAPAVDPLAPKFAALTRREKELRAMQEKFEAERSEWQKKQEEFAQASSLKEKNVLEWLKSQGMDYETITEAVLNDGKPGADYHVRELEKRIEDKFKSWEQKQAEAEEARKAQEQAQYTKAAEGFKEEIAGFIAGNPDKYEFTSEHPEHVGLVYDLVEQHYLQNGKLLSIEEASDLVERHFEDQAKKLAQKKKFSTLFGEQTKSTQETKPASNFYMAESKTLSNSEVTKAPTQVHEAEARTPEERMRRALEAMERSQNRG